MKRFDFRAAGKTLEILFYGDIGDSFDGVTAKQFAEDLKPHSGVSEINLRMNSVGGDVFDGAAIYNMLLRHRARVIVDVDGAALSAASLVAMAGDVIRMAENSMMMVHDPWGMSIGSADDMRSYAATLDKLKAVYSDTYSKRTGIDGKEMDLLMSEETWMTAEEAVKMGFAQEVTGPKRMAAYVPAGRYRKTPAEMTLKPPTIAEYRQKLTGLSCKLEGA